jgi:Zn finger protein HypA/HybF involved in hydrogenase expression
MKKRSSVIWDLSKKEFQELINSSTTRSDVLKKLNLRIGSYKILRHRIEEENINIDHFILNASKTRIHKPKIPLNEILIENSTYTSIASLKKRLLKTGLLENKCYECGLMPEWNGKNLSIQLDHKNGINNDHRLKNLRMLCPNCHSQTDNYAGRNMKRRHMDTTICIDCKCKISAVSIRCRNCYSITKFNKNTKIEWPTDEELIIMLNNSNFLKLSKELGVSDNAVRKRLKRRKLL